MMLTRTMPAIAGIAAAAVLAACTPADTTVASNVAASADLNGGLPAKATVFYLNSTATFLASDYASLAGDAQATLGADLVAKDEVLLSPGQTKPLARSFPGEGPTAVGVIVGFKSIDTAQWRATTGIAGGKVNTLTIAIGSGSVKISK